MVVVAIGRDKRKMPFPLPVVDDLIDIVYLDADLNI